MTKEDYEARATIYIDAVRTRDRMAIVAARRRGAKPMPTTEFDMLTREPCKSVMGRSVLTQLPYFDIVNHTLLDMMHINQGLMSRHLVAMLKDRLDAWKGIQPALKLPAAVEGPIIFVPKPPDLEKGRRYSIGQKAAHARSKTRYQTYIKGVSAAGESVRARTQLSTAHRERGVLHAAYLRYHLAPRDLDALDLAYQTIEAPLNIAPASKRPFALTGSMTAHHWVNFVKVFGKYLFQRAFTPLVPRLPAPPVVVLPNVPLVGTSKLLNLLRTCLSSNATTEMKAKATRQAKDLAFTFDEYFPVIEKSMIMHALIFHIPDTICVWGPVRNWWCFPFERYER